MLNKHDKEEIKRRSTYDHKPANTKMDLQEKSNKLGVILEHPVDSVAKEKLANEMGEMLDQQLKVINKETIVVPGNKLDEMEMEEPKLEDEQKVKGD